MPGLNSTYTQTNTGSNIGLGLNEDGLEYEALAQEDFDFDDINDGFYDALEEDTGLFPEVELFD